MGNVATAIIFWVVVRDKTTLAIISATPFKTHHEAVEYNLDADHGPESSARQVSIEILSEGKKPVDSASARGPL